MRKYIILFFSALPFLAACDKTPQGILKPDRMVQALTEVHMVDASLDDIEAPNADSLYKFGLGRYVALFKKLHTDTVQFRKSLKYYTARPEQMETMYGKILDNLQKKIDSMNNVIRTPTHTNAVPHK